MKTKIKRHSRSVLSVVLAVCMLVSCMTVGLIATDAAKVSDSGAIAATDDSESVGVNTYFTNGETLFIHAADIGNSAYGDSATVKAWFRPSGSAPITAKVGGVNNNYYYAIVDAAAYTGVQIQRFSSDGSTWWNSNGDVNQSSRGNDAYNVIKTTSKGSSGASWENATYTFYVVGDFDSWDSTSMAMTDDGDGKFVYTTDAFSATKTSYEYKIKGSDGTWYTGDGNRSLSGFTVGSNYTVTFTFDITDNTVTAEKTEVANPTYTVSASAGSNGSVAIGTNSPVSGSDTSLSFDVGTNNTVYVKATPDDFYKVGTWSPTPTSTTEDNGVVTATFSVSAATAISVTFEEEPVYGVTGNEGLTGNDWDVANSANDMTKSGSNYTKTYTKAAGSYEFKITKNRAWSNSVGYSTNVSFTGVAENNGSSDGNNIKFKTSVPSSITITFTPSNTIVVNAVSTETTYSVTVKSGAGTFTTAGNNTDQTVTAGSVTAATLPQVTPPNGKVFSTWTSTGSVTLNNATSNGSATVNATAAGGVVTATYEDLGETVVYVAKNDNVSKIYAWNSDGNISAEFPGDTFDNNNQVYDIGGIEYYKYTVDTGTKDFNFIVSNGTSGRQSNDALGYAAGHTYYVQWYGTTTKADVKNIGVDWYPEYYLVYKAASAEDVAANWTRVAFSNSTATLSGLTAQNYVFYIVRQDMVSGSKVDNYWYNNGDKTITHSNHSNVYTTHVIAGNITLTADAPGDYTVTIDAMNGDTAITIHADYPTGYRVVGDATFFGNAWDTSSSNYEFMLTEMASSKTIDGNVYTHSYAKTMNYSVGTFSFKVWDTGDNWHPSGAGTDIEVTNGVKRGQTITFYYNPGTGNVAYEITGTPDAESWPPSDIQEKMDASSNPLVEQDTSTYTSQYNTLIYKIASGSNAITSSPVTFSPLYQKTEPGETGEWWADFTSILPGIGNDQLYFNITSNGSYTGFYATSNMTFDTTEAPGITVKKTDKDSSYYFVEVSEVDSRVTNLGVYITKSGSNFTYKFYTIKGSASASKTVKVYAKDGAIRRVGTARDPSSNITYSTFEQHANTFIYSDSAMTDHIGTRSSTHGASGNDELTDTTVFDRYTYDYAASINKGDTIYIKTVLKDDDYMNQYYLVGYSINGTVYQLHTVAESRTGTVTETFTIPTEWDYNYVEITPIYFLRSGDSIRFYVEGYDQTVMDTGWGNTVGVYPYYQNPADNDQVANVNNPFGGYPGQPLVFYKGNYYADLPKTYTAYTENSTSAVTCEIKGITLSNMYWDDVHLYTGEVSLHYQTYDFDDLYKIYKEYGNDVDNIICAFKYRNRKNNDEPANMTGWTSSNYDNYTNGWELLRDYAGNAIDIFGNILDPQPSSIDVTSSGVVHVVSQDYKSNSAGQYGTEWAVYNTAGTKVEGGGKTTIVPSALAIKNSANFSNYDAQTKAFQGIYNALKADSNVVGKPVFITYEKSIYGGGDKADRCDARWFFSQKGAQVNATTRIEYSDDLGETWTTDSFNANTATGSHTGSTAYFTGLSTAADNTPETAAGNTTTTDTSKNDDLEPRIGEGYYVFNATSGEGYKFVGWYILRDNYQSNAPASSYASGTTNFTSHAEIAKDGDIFVARFVKVTSGSFTINHRVHKDSTGFGDVYVEAVVKDSSGTQLGTTYGSTSGANPTSSVTIPSDTGYIANNSGNTIEAKFVPSPYGTSEFVNFYATVNDLLNGFNEYNYIKSIEINMPGVDGYDSSKGIYALVTYDVDNMFSVSSGSPTQTVSSVTHYSRFALKNNISYSLQYTFKTRYYGNKTYSYSDNFTENELRSYFYDQITTKANETIQLDKQFVQSKAPFESNYREDLTWVVDDVTFNATHTAGYLTAHQEDLKWSTAMVYDLNDAGALVTHKMVAPYMKLFDTTIQAKPTFETTSEEAEYINAWSKGDGDMYYQLRNYYTENNTEKPIYIERWDVYQLDSFTYNKDNNGNPVMLEDGINLSVDTSKSALVAQCYSTFFNYVGFEDYAIVPVYSKTRVKNQELSDARDDSSASLLTITRNHWNGTVSGNEQGGSFKDGADRLYVDFMLNYNYPVTVDGVTQNVRLSTTDNNIKVGFVIRSYTMNNGERVYSSKSQTVLVDKSQIDNKNRIEYCYGFNNSQNNSRWGLMFEFTPFIVDTSNQSTSTGADVVISGTTYKALRPIDDADVLRGVNFYMIGNSDVDWN